MTTRTKIILLVVGLIAMAGLGGGIIVVPNYAESNRVNAQIRDFYARMNGFAQQAERVEQLARELRQLERQIDVDLKIIPQSPDAELLIGKLSLPIDGRTIRDQTFTTGQPGPAAANSDIAAQALPLTVEMEAQFESIFATLRLAETMDRLIRVTSVRIERQEPSRVQEEDHFDQPLLTASIGLDAVFEPAPGSATGPAGIHARPSRERQDAPAGIRARPSIERQDAAAEDTSP